MKRDMDLIRSILLAFEKDESKRHGKRVIADLADDDQISMHLALLEDAGFLDTQIIRMGVGGASLHSGWRLTWEGHEFIEKIRDPEIWTKTKAGATKVGSWSIKLISDIAAGIIKAKAAELGIVI
jgi:Hypothetical protein (DUF2513)